MAWVRSVLLPGHIPKTVICIPSWSTISVKIFSSQLIPFFWSKMSRYTSSAPHRSAYLATCSISLLMVASRDPHAILHSMTKRWHEPSGSDQRIKRSVLPFPSPYSRVICPPPLIIRWRNAWRSSCGPASRYVNRSSQISLCSRKNCRNSWRSFSRMNTFYGLMTFLQKKGKAESIN